MSSAQKRSLILLIAFSAISLAFWTYQENRSRREHLFARANGREFTSTTDAVSAVLELEKDRSATATEMLVSLSTTPDSSSLPGTKRLAIKALSARASAEVANEIAGILQPHESLEVRLAVAQALRSQTCTVQVATSVISYRDRIDHGERTPEDSPDYPIDVRNELQNDRRELEAALNQVLVRCGAETTAALERSYGFGSLAPSIYGMQLAREAHLKASCALLSSSGEQLKRLQNRDEKFFAIVQETLRSLQCDVRF